MNKTIITLSLLEYPHTGARKNSAMLEKKNREYHIENKIISMTLDNIASNQEPKMALLIK